MTDLTYCYCICYFYNTFDGVSGNPPNNHIGMYPFVRYRNIITGIKLKTINKLLKAINLLFDKEPNTTPIGLRTNVSIP